MEVGQCNIRSLNTSTKLIEDLVKKTQIRMLAFTEIWHPDANKNLLSSWRWFKNERKEREGGGAAIVLHPSIKSWPRDDLKLEEVESAWCELSLNNQRILVCSMYVAPGDEAAMDRWLTQIEQLQHENPSMLLTGDFNAKQTWRKAI